MDSRRKFSWKATIELNVLFLKMSGFWPRNDDTFKLDLYTSRTIILVTVFLLVGLLSQLINLFFILDDLIALTGTIYILLTEILFALKIYYLARNMSIVKKLMRMLDDDLFQPRDVGQVALVQPNLDVWKMIYKAFMTMCCGANLFWAVFPLLDKSSEGNRLPFLAWYPYNTKIFPMYEITYGHQVLSYTYTCFTHINVDTFIAAINVYTASQFDILCDNLKNLHLSNNVGANFAKCVRHHWMILNFAYNSNKFFNWIILLQFCVSATITAMTLFQLTIVEPLTTEFFSFVSYGMAAVTQIFMYCWFGNEVQIKSNNLPFAVYECKWTNFSVKTQKNIFFFILRSQKPVKVSASNVFYLSLESFMMILKTSWSYFALLQQVSS
ncbi:hypothetical protein Zmor_007798 [Zophobas morio]|uniref:Odorant receptor n=1 Tax=Zophobas morio TaxID=2755281 RepID=A0AA38MMD4_9CUCU|nr:hypothetical protein Zmor_007798 [Zophobas morio]